MHLMFIIQTHAHTPKFGCLSPVPKITYMWLSKLSPTFIGVDKEKTNSISLLARFIIKIKILPSGDVHGLGQDEMRHIHAQIDFIRHCLAIRSVQILLFKSTWILFFDI